jgi:molybdopterin synthase catalytic subunit
VSQSVAGGDVIRLIGVRETPLSIDEVYNAVGAPGAGGIAVFTGTVRDHDHARAVMEKVAADFPVLGLAAVHRVGDLDIGDIAVVVAASSAHRAEAFAACRRLIDDLKANVPIWKHQTFTDGDDEWVGAC